MPDPEPGTAQAPPAQAAPAPTAPMREGRPGVLVLRVIGLVVLAGVVLAGSGQVIGAFFRQTATVTSTLPGSVREIVIADAVGDIDVRAGTAAAGRLVRRESWSFGRPEVTSSMRGDVLTISAHCPAHWAPFAGQFCRVHLDLTVAATTRIVVGARTGDVLVRGIRAPVQATTSTGDVTVEGVTCSEVHARSRTGDITLADVNAAAVQAETRTGDVASVRLTSTDVQAQTSTGDIRLGLAAGPGTLHARTATGDVQVRVPQDGTVYRVSATTSVGTTRVGVPTASDAAHQLDLVTSVGDITVGLQQG